MGFRSKEIRLAGRPAGMPDASHFALASVDLPDPGPGEALVRNLWMSVDPYMRGLMNIRPGYQNYFPLGEALRGRCVGRVVASRDPALQEGDLVKSFYGWREGYVAPATELEKLPALDVSPETFLSVLGAPALTAYGGLLRCIEPKAGETLFVSGAAGMVGSIAAQIGKIRGCRVIASAGSGSKVAWLESLGLDHVVNYKTCGDLTEALRAGAPEGIDAYFDNVGAAHLEAALDLARPFARFAECGMISQYNSVDPQTGPRNFMLMITRCVRMQGFVVSNFTDLQDAFQSDMIQWIAAGRIKWKQTVETGVENAPKAFLNLFTGDNTGKMLVQLG